MIVTDFETSGLHKPLAVPLDEQPHAIEFAAIKLHDEPLEEVGRLEFLIRPPEGIKLDAEVIEITHITDEMLVDQKPFIEHYPALVDFFLGERYMVAHNCSYERNQFFFELKRLGLGTKFPWPPVHICTVEKTFEIKGYRMKLKELHELATGAPHAEQHRAMPDVEALVTCVRWLRQEGYL